MTVVNLKKREVSYNSLWWDAVNYMIKNLNFLLFALCHFLNNILSFQKVWRINFYSVRCHHEVPLLSQILIGCSDLAWHHALLMTSHKVPQTYWTLHNFLYINHPIMLCPVLMFYSDLSPTTTVTIQSNPTMTNEYNSQ